MRNILYTVAVILTIIWAVGFFGFSLGNLIHILLAIALISVLFAIIRGNKI